MKALRILVITFVLCLLCTYSGICLSPPWWTYFHLIKNTIGADKNLEIPLMYEDGDIYRIDVFSSKLDRAKALAGIISRDKVIGNITVRVRVFLKGETTPIDPPDLPEGADPLAFTQEMIETALGKNPLFVTTHTPPWLVNLFVEFKNDIVQFWNDDISDYYCNAKFIADDAFMEVMNHEYYDAVFIGGTTSSKICFNCPWCL